MGRRKNEPTRTVTPDETQPGHVVLFRIGKNVRWLLLDQITGQDDTAVWHGRLVYAQPGHYDDTTLTGPADEWRRRCVMRQGRCVIKSDADAARDRARLDILREDHADA